ncbi:PREDICTED: uncharacterized protein LOC108520789 [Rhinopithecus bieti]|uniref:uncharacterized protein LOC108520789 n=1 Tax=Rhinopithecus bieti TaxID=61621 RepID=UPI00083BCA42|nr:PREDICTED: uncharacterized protein LOC108520789 [Rhinopithecus bieti]
MALTSISRRHREGPASPGPGCWQSPLPPCYTARPQCWPLAVPAGPEPSVLPTAPQRSHIAAATSSQPAGRSGLQETRIPAAVILASSLSQSEENRCEESMKKRGVRAGLTLPCANQDPAESGGQNKSPASSGQTPASQGRRRPHEALWQPRPQEAKRWSLPVSIPAAEGGAACVKLQLLSCLPGTLSSHPAGLDLDADTGKTQVYSSVSISREGEQQKLS